MEINDFTELCKRVNSIKNEEDGKFISDILLGLRESNQIDDIHLVIMYIMIKCGWKAIKDYLRALPIFCNLSPINNIIINNIPHGYHNGVQIYFKDEAITSENISKVYEKINKLY